MLYNLDNLNEPQRQAVLNQDGPLLVIAGAGSGKTRVITTRIAHLSQTNSTESIVALTFTNKAAQEMRSRLESFGIIKSRSFIGTFHGYSLALLKQYGSLINQKEINILDDEDQLSIVNKIIKARNYTNKLNARSILYQISQAKNELALGASSAKAFAGDQTLESIYRAYEEAKDSNKTLDFDDLIVKAVKLFRNQDFRNLYQSRVRHLLVDEYQDTNALQHELVKLITLQEDSKKLAIDSICAVGDDDQSIYSWRGATVSNMLDFAKDFESTKLIRIEQNYRSTQQILTIANNLISNNSFRNEKNLWSEKSATQPVIRFNCMTSHQEAATASLVINSIKEKSPNHSIAILYRTHFQSRILEETLLRSGISYKIIGGIQFYERKEIKDLLAYLKIITNPYDKIAFFRILNCPPRKLGAQFESIINEKWQEEPFLSFKQIADLILDSLTGQRKSQFIKFLDIINKYKETNNASETLQDLIEQVEYINYLKDSFDAQEAQQKIENVYELVRAARHGEENGSITISQFLHDVTLMQEKLQKQNNEAEAVQLMTIHAAKGLEFDAVLVTGLEEGTLPSSRSLYKTEAIEEERRLLYVAITRAKNELYFLHCTYRNSYGQTSTLSPSRFIEELPNHLISSFDCATSSDYEIRGYLQKGNTQKTSLKPAETIKPNNSKLAINRTVEHASFGVGVIKGLENKVDGSTIVTVQFKTGFKKIAAQFLKQI